MNCQKITQLLNKVKSKNSELKQFSVRPTDGLIKKLEVQAILDEIFNSIDPTWLVKRQLEDENNWENYDKLVEATLGGMGTKWLNFTNANKKAEEIFGNFQSRGVLTTEYYDNFLRFLTSFEKIAQKHFEELEKKFKTGESHETGFFLGIVNSLFLKKAMKPESSIVIKNLPNFLKGHAFAKNLPCGTIQIDEVGRSVGEEMTGGEIIVSKAGSHAGLGMKGGRIEILEETVGETGYCMKGGKIKVRNHSHGDHGSLGYESDHGTVVAEATDEYAGCGSGTDILVNKAGDKLGSGKWKGVIIANEAGNELGRPDNYGHKENWGTLLVGRFSDPEPTRSKIETFQYDDTGKKYINLLSMKEVLPGNLTETDLSEFKSNKKGLIILDDIDGFRQNITEGMDGGIIVLKKLPKEELGKGMNRGAIIIDNPEITKEEIQKVLSKDRQYGLILMRIPDPENPDRTKLVDVED